MNRPFLATLFVSVTLLTGVGSLLADTQSLQPQLIHLRSGEAQEWRSFPEKAENTELEIRFTGAKNADEATLVLRQQDVKQSWRVRVNDRQIGTLTGDENDMLLYLPIAAGALRDGENVLRIEPAKRTGSSDDIRVGEIAIDSRPRSKVLDEGRFDVRVIDAKTGEPLPARITIARVDGALQPTSATSNDEIAVRAGVIYTGSGAANFGVPAGEYVVYAGRGFEYSVASAQVKIAPGESAERTLKIAREVPTDGYVACDTHIHTLTYSGHGDATIAERMLTIAGEGIELPIATDHNKHIDYEEHARRLGVRKYFTPVRGNEVTTAVGHFNIFPIDADARVADHQRKTWAEMFEQISATHGVRAIILNHARDVHAGTRPFGPALFNEAIGERVDGWPMKFNAMEVMNSGATQTDPLQLSRDWMALLNRGYTVTPVGSSDSHDVSRFIVGQARTYIRCDDRDAGEIDVHAAIENFLAGRVVVSYGLFAELTVDDKFRPGDLATGDGETCEVRVRVLGPHWASVDRVRLFANGQLLKDIATETRTASDKPLPSGVKWEQKLRIDRPTHDVALVAIASGLGVVAPYWAMAKPYQPTSPDDELQALSISGAVWIDGDGNARRTSARDYAEALVKDHGGDANELLQRLAKFDAAVAAQAAHAYRLAHEKTWLDDLNSALNSAAPQVAAGVRSYLAAWRANELAQAER